MFLCCIVNILQIYEICKSLRSVFIYIFLYQLFLELGLYIVSILEANKPVSIRGIKS